MRTLFTLCFRLICFAAACSVVVQAGEISERDWPWWRGPECNGIAHPESESADELERIGEHCLESRPFPVEATAHPLSSGIVSC